MGAIPGWRNLAAIAALVLLELTSPPVAAGMGVAVDAHPQASAAAVMGDVNCGGTVDTVDALQILRLSAGLSTNAACMDPAGDVDCDGDKDAVDALRILRHVAGLSNTVPDGCTPIGEAIGGGPSSEELIDAALAADEINDEEALVYRVYASFGDSRLPAQYKGDDSQEQDSSVMPEVVARFAGLSIENQALLQPFLLPPNAPGSWFQLGSHSAPSIANPAEEAVMFLPVETSPHVKVWYREQHPEDQATAQAMANDIDSTIWPKLTGLFGEPMSDAGRDDNGGDGRVDIFLLDAGPRSSASPYLCQHGPGLINLRRNASRPVLAHELTHVILFSYRVKTECQWPEYQWLHEATAQWAMDFVYQEANEEFAGRECFLSDPGMPMETTNDCREYDAYIWNFFLRWEYGPELIRDTWVNAFQNDSLGAINKAVSGGLKEVWPKFVLDNYNLPPLDLYRQMDSVPFGAKLMDDVNVDLGGAASKTYSMRGDVEHMAALYHRYSFNDPSIKSVIFTQPFSDGSQPTAKVQAVIEIAGQQPKIEDWTSFARKQFCFDKPEEEIDQLLIVISNSEYQNRGSVLMSNPQPELRVSSLGCTGWEGTVKVTETADSAGSSVTAVASGQVRFEIDPDLVTPGEPARYYKTTSGIINWTYTGALLLPAICTINGSGSFPVGGWGSLEVWDDGGDSLRYHGVGLHPPELPLIKVTFTCDAGGGPITFDQFPPFNAWQTWFCACSATEEFRVDASGTTIKGSYTEPGLDILHTVKWEWDLHRQ